MKTSVLIAAFSVLATSAAWAAAPVQTSGDVLTGTNGMTLYTFDKDAAGSGKPPGRSCRLPLHERLLQFRQR